MFKKKEQEAKLITISNAEISPKSSFYHHVNLLDIIVDLIFAKGHLENICIIRNFSSFEDEQNYFK